MSFLRAASLGVFVLGSACAVSEDPSTSSVQQEAGCPTWMCGTNSPEIDHRGIHDLNLDGAPNANGFRLVGATKAGTSYKVNVKRAKMSATAGATTLVGSSLIGLQLHVKNDATGDQYDIVVADVGRTPYWAKITGSEMTTTYVLDWDIVRGYGQKREWKAVCTNAPKQGNPDLLGMNQFHSVVFEGDRINATTKVVESVDYRWFNVGCAGHAVAKQHLMGHSEGAQNEHHFASSTTERTANLKMLVADYCGTGKPFTVSGQPLEWKDANSWMGYSFGFTGELEAQWSETGATCLNVPRIDANPTWDGMAAFPALADEIYAECGKIPPCTTTDPLVLGGHHIVSANP